MRNFILNMAIIFFGVFSNLVLNTSDAYSRVILKEKTEYYEITGNSGFQLYSDMIKSGPIKEGSKERNLATTTFKFKLENDVYTINNKRCMLSNIDIIINVTYIKPRWNDGNTTVKNSLKIAWKKFQVAINAHQAERVKITKKLANDYERALRKSHAAKEGKCGKDSFGIRFLKASAFKKHRRAHNLLDKQDFSRGGKSYKALIELIKAK